MKIFQDIFNGQELLSDSYKIQMTYGDVIGQVQSRMVAKGEDNVDVGCGNAFGGKNEQDEGQNGGDNGTPVFKVNDLVDAFHYEDTSFDKAGFAAYFKEYMKKLLTWLGQNRKDRVEPFKAGARDFFKWANAHFDDLSFYTGQNYDMQNLIVMSYYKVETDEAPTFLYVMDGFKSYKV